MILKIYRLLSKRGLGKIFPEWLMFKIQDLILKISKDTIKIKVGKYDMNVFKDSDFNFIFRKKYHEEGLTKLLPIVTKDIDLFIDVGSCWGYYILLSNAKRNIAIEPDIKNYNLLLKNIEENKINNTTCYKLGIANKTEPRIFYKTKKYGTHSLRNNYLDKGNAFVGGEIIKVTTLDTLLKDYLGQKMLFKIDIEGLEAQAFKGMKKLLTTNNIEIIFECNLFKYNKKDWETINDVVKSFDSIIIIDDVKGSWETIPFKKFLKLKDEIKEGWKNIYLKRK